MRSLEIPLRSSNCREANEKNVGSTRPKNKVLEMFFVSGSLTLIPASVVSVRTWKILSPVFSKITLICLSPYCAVAPPFPPNTMLDRAGGARDTGVSARAKMSVYFERPTACFHRPTLGAGGAGGRP